MSGYVRLNSAKNNYSSNSWTVLTDIERRIKDKIEAVGTPLKDWDIQINYGIKTGFNEAFIVDGEKRKELIAKHPKSEEIIRPILRGRDIKRYGYKFADLWLIYIPWHFPLHNDSTITGVSKEAEIEFVKQYPEIYNHLLQYKNQLSNRNKAETGIRYEWYALQRWGANYWEDFNEPKIIFQEMVQESSFSFDSNEKFLCLDTGRIITGENLHFLLSILNSNLFLFAIKNYYGGGGLGESGVRMKHTFFENFNCPKLSLLNQKPFIDLTLKIISFKKNDMPTEHLETIINSLVYELYELQDIEREYIESNTWKQTKLFQ